MLVFRAKQLLIDPETITNQSRRDREMLAAERTFVSGESIAEHKASDWDAEAC